MRSSEETLQAIKDMVHSYPPEVEAWLFGSRARGDARPDSDWDVLLLLDKDGRIVSFEEYEYSNTLTVLGFNINAEINPVIMTKRRWEETSRQTAFYHNVMEDRVRL